jgi:creatinine amidohydrolase
MSLRPSLAVMSLILMLSPVFSLEMRSMTSPEIRARIAAGYRHVILPTGGIEQNGPHMALEKHDRIVAFGALEIARRLGNTLVAPVVSFVPEGNFSPPTDNMKWPGTIGLSDAVFEGVLDNIARSLKLAGFRTILIIGDHGQSQAVQTRIAQKLSREWAREGVRVIQIDAWYDDRAQEAMLKTAGETAATIGGHAGIMDTAELMAIAPELVDLEKLKGVPRPLDPAGASGTPERATAELGRKLIEIRIDQAVKAIRLALGL